MMKILEEELYLPIKKYFERKGFQIKAEVKNCDIAGIKDDVLIIVELKTSFNIKLIYQAIERQKITDCVYVAIPRPKNFNTKDVKSMRLLLKKLNIGLIVVNFGEKRTMVQVISDPIVQDVSKKKNLRREKVLREFSERKGDFNIGGKNRTKIVTAYLEKSIEIACFLELLTKTTGAELKRLGCDKNSNTIMRNNFYGWFSKIDRGVYTLSEKGINYLNGDEFADIIQFYRKEVITCLKYQETTDVGVEVAKNTKLVTKDKMTKN